MGSDYHNLEDFEKFLTNNNVGWTLFLNAIVDILETDFNDDNPLITFTQLRNFKTTFEIAATLGIIPGLISKVKDHMNLTRSKTLMLNLDNSTLEKHKRLSETTLVFLKCYDKEILRSTLLSELDCLLAALLQISHAPLMKPKSNTSVKSTSDFEMTEELYEILKIEQEEFHEKLLRFMENCPQSMLIKELMVLKGIKDIPNWLRIKSQNYVINLITQPNGVGALTVALCGEIDDIGKCWNSLDVTARLLVASHGKDKDFYYNSVCNQILELLNHKNDAQKLAIGKYFTTALYNHDSQVCMNKIIKIIIDPFLINNDQSNVIDTEKIIQSLELLEKLFLTHDAKFKNLPVDILMPIVLPLLHLYTKPYDKIIQSYSSQIRQLLLKILNQSSDREKVFDILINQKNDTSRFNDKLNLEGSTELNLINTLIKSEKIGKSLFDLFSDDELLSIEFFMHLLKKIPEIFCVTRNEDNINLLETKDDVLERFFNRMEIVQVLKELSGVKGVQKALIKNPEPLLKLTEFYFTKLFSNTKNQESQELDIEFLYTLLMVIKSTLDQEDNIKSWKLYKDFFSSMKKNFDFKKIPVQIVTIFEEIMILIAKEGKISRNYCDLSTDSKNISDFDKALKDLNDPLIPVQAHGITVLTKLIKNRHPRVKEIDLLNIFQHHLGHEDSYIYLAAINGICALSIEFPAEVIEILVTEFIGLTQNINRYDITSETRTKIGEILVKTTRELGEMTPKYKTLLVNCFLCGTKDSDPLVRASSLSCLGELCKIMGFKLGNLINEILYCIECIVSTDKDDSCRRAGVLVAKLLLQGLGRDALTELGKNLVGLYRSLKHLHENDRDMVLRVQAQLALEELDDIVKQFLFVQPKYEKTIFLLKN